VARYCQDYYAGKPAITRHHCGDGQAIYIGTVGDASLYEILIEWLLEQTNIRPLLAVPAGVEVTERWQGEQRFLFLLNHSDCLHEIPLDGQYYDLLHDVTVAGTISIASRDILILTQNT
jgi:beta-galactosidase